MHKTAVMLQSLSAEVNVPTYRSTLCNYFAISGRESPNSCLNHIKNVVRLGVVCIELFLQQIKHLID